MCEFSPPVGLKSGSEKFIACSYVEDSGCSQLWLNKVTFDENAIMTHVTAEKYQNIHKRLISQIIFGRNRVCKYVNWTVTVH